MSIPVTTTKAYHATPEANENSIKSAGLIPGSDNLIYMADDMPTALSYARMWQPGYDIYTVFEIDLTMLDSDLLRREHRNTFAGTKEFFSYPKAIPPDVLSDFDKAAFGEAYRSMLDSSS